MNKMTAKNTGKTALNIGKNEDFCINNKFQCKLLEDVSEWTKDGNTTSRFKEALLDVVDGTNNGNEHLLGLLSIQYDEDLNDKHYAHLFVKHTNANEWESMHNVISITS